MSLEVTILGCGSSGGVPRVGQGWGACDPRNPKNRRRRCSILVKKRAEPGGDATSVLVDMSPDLREQLLDADVQHLDAIVMTHSHADHTHGIDDVRPLVIKARRRLRVYMDEYTASVLRKSFGYIFQKQPGSNYPPLLDGERLTAGERIDIDGRGGAVSVVPFRLEHGEIDALGLRFGSIAYTPDLNAIPDESVDHLRDLDVWIIDALRYTRHPSHFSLDEALAWIERLKPRRAVLTNLHTDLDYETLAGRLPQGVVPAYDGMQIILPDGSAGGYAAADIVAARP